MEIIVNLGTSYLSSTFRRDLNNEGKTAGNEGLLNAAGDRVEISEQGRAMQAAEYGQDKSKLMSYIDGDEKVEDSRLAYNGPGSAADDSGEDDTDTRIRELQLQLREAMKRLQDARQELTDAQAKRIAEVKAMQNGEDPESVSESSQQLIEQECTMAKQKVVAAQAEVNTIQEQLQKLLSDKNKEAQAMMSGGSGGSVGSTWEPQGTNDYIGGNW